LFLFTEWPLKPCSHCHRKRRLSQKSATVAENGEKTATVAEIGDSVDRQAFRWWWAVKKLLTHSLTQRLGGAYSPQPISPRHLSSLEGKGVKCVKVNDCPQLYLTDAYVVFCGCIIAQLWRFVSSVLNSSVWRCIMDKLCC